jgi:hypothetical protein
MLIAHRSPQGLLAATLLLVLLCAPTAISAQSLDSFLSPLGRQQEDAVRASEALKRDLDSWRDVELLPDHHYSEDIRESLEDARPNVLSETLILIPNGITDSQFLELYNSLRRVSELGDIEYYNPEKEKWHPLFTYSHRVPDEDSERALPDPVVDRIPREDEMLVLQGLPPFGDTVSRYAYRHRGGAFLFSSRNLTRIKYRGFPVVGPEEMITHFLLLRGEDFVLLYGVGGAQVFNFLGLLSGVIENSFESRTTGLFDWYSATYLEPLRTATGADAPQ